MLHPNPLRSCEADAGHLGSPKCHVIRSDRSANSAPSGQLVVWRYYESDDLGIFFVKAGPEMISETDQVADHIVADYDDNNKLVSVDINAASDILPPCHFFDTAEYVDGKPPFTITQQFDAMRDELTIFFMDAKKRAAEVKTDDERLVLGLDVTGKLACITVRLASSSIAI